MGLMKIINQEVRCGQEKSEVRGQKSEIRDRALRRWEGRTGRITDRESTNAQMRTNWPL